MLFLHEKNSHNYPESILKDIQLSYLSPANLSFIRKLKVMGTITNTLVYSNRDVNMRSR